MSTPQSTAPPASVRKAMTAIWAIVVLRLVGTALQVLVPEQFQLADEVSNEAVPVGATVLSVMFGVGLIAVFILFALSFQRGARWARTTLLILSLLFLAFSFFGLINILVGADVSTLTTVMNVLNFALLATLVNFLVKADTAEWCTR